MTTIQRCTWAESDELLTHYHDKEWGVPVHDDRHLFEMLNLEGAQAGLSWLTILKRRDNYRAAFDNFDAQKIAQYDEPKRVALLQDAGIIRNRLKINAVIENAKAYLAAQQTYGSFDAYVWNFVHGKPLTYADQEQAIEISKHMSKDFKKHGFRFAGPTTCYAFMQATGMINDHTPECFCYAKIASVTNDPNLDSISCDIVLLPADDVVQRAMNLSEQLQSHGALFQLQRDTCFPHVSLYMTQLKVADLEKAQELLRDIASRVPHLALKVTGYGQAEGYIDVDYERTGQLADMQMAVVHAINPIRDGLRAKDKQRMQTAVGAVRKNLETYGYRGVGDLFRPHITFTRFVDGQPIATDSLPDVNQFDGQLTRLVLCEMGDNGTCARLIAAFDLAQ